MHRERELILALGARDLMPTLVDIYSSTFIPAQHTQLPCLSWLHIVFNPVLEVFGLSPESGRAPSSNVGQPSGEKDGAPEGA